MVSKKLCQKRCLIKKEAGGKADTYTPGGAVNRASEFVELRLEVEIAGGVELNWTIASIRLRSFDWL